MTRIKCCGMYRAEDIEAVNAAQPDYCGFIIDFPQSHRSVPAKKARELRRQLEPGVAAVGVFVDQPVQRVADIARDCELTAVQLHGHEDEAYVLALRHLTSAPVIKAFRVRNQEDLKRSRISATDFVLLDNGQGTGKSFDWKLIGKFDRPYFLAGGLTPENLREAVDRLAPFAVDLSSGLETNGVKDPEKIAKAVRVVRELDRMRG